MIKKYVLAELGDVEFTESDSGRGALDLLSHHSFDLGICDSELGDMHMIDFKQQVMETSANNRGMDFITLCGTDDDRQRLVKAGFKHLVPLPFNPKEFIDIINDISNPRKMRAAARYHIPDSSVVISVWGMEAWGRMINISQGGVLAEVSGDRSELLLQNNPKLTLSLKVPGGYYDINDLPAKLVRLSASGWDKNFKPIIMRVAYIFQNLNQHAKAELEKIIKLAEDDRLVADGEPDDVEAS
jgi:CheY-like chemotaxis protein